MTDKKIYLLRLRHHLRLCQFILGIPDTLEWLTKKHKGKGWNVNAVTYTFRNMSQRGNASLHIQFSDVKPKPTPLISDACTSF